MKLKSVLVIGVAIFLFFALFQWFDINDAGRTVQQVDTFEELDVASGKKYILQNVNVVTMANDEVLYN